MVSEGQLDANPNSFDIPRAEAPCALCGSLDATLLFEISGRTHAGVYHNGIFRPVAGPERIVRCRECGLIYVNPRLAATPGITTYSNEEEQAYFEATRPDRRVGNEGLLQRLEQSLGGPGRLLDVGCGDGLLLAQARNRGWDPRGLEVSSNLVAKARADGLAPIFHGALDQAEYAPDSFDAVTLINVIEHLQNPGDTLAEIARITRPHGVVAVHTPNVNSLAARWRGPTWHHFEPLEHFYYFGAHTLGHLMEQKGLAVIGSFSLHGTSAIKRALLTAIGRLGLRLDNGLGLLARKTR